jgi:saccharopine dehydrogenase-like NADP-dependent oxidoreductase
VKKIAVFGAGRSTYYLFEYLNNLIERGHALSVKVYDNSEDNLKQQLNGLAHISGHNIDVGSALAVQNAIMGCDIAVSMLPPALHMNVARFCIEHSKHLATASYVSPEMQALHNEALVNGLIFINELGLDPGIDHLSAMQTLDRLRSEGAEITGFESFCGGLIAEQYVQDNPWKYKFTWNPRNVVLAGQSGMAVYRHHGHIKCIPYNGLFKRYDIYALPGYGKFEAYANRDSLGYEKAYGLEGVPTLYRGTLRKAGFCDAWNTLVQLGMTDNQTYLQIPGMTGLDFLEVFLPDQGLSIEARIEHLTGANRHSIEALRWLGLMDRTPLPLQEGTPAEILLELLKERWELGPDDHDLVVMMHETSYRLQGKDSTIRSWMTVEGEDTRRTAMAKTVGLPLAMGVRLIAEDRIQGKGVMIPTDAQWYEPIMRWLKEYGIQFHEETLSV